MDVKRQSMLDWGCPNPDKMAAKEGGKVKNSTDRANELKLEMFGTPEQVEILAKTEWKVATREEARAILRKIANKPLKSRAGIEATLSLNSIEKILSGKSVDKSFSKEAHFLAAANLEQLFANAIEPFKFGTNPDKNNEHLRAIHRLYAPMAYKDMIIPVKFTVKEWDNEKDGSRIYSLEAIDFPLGKK
ncbi:MAG: hypothetical protein LBT39_11370 [Treponema sp.]|jgi:hypothetical protein|nr:hypothetical protein [Treponema sp.]